uniref:RING-type domain-containing protein n=1 Tax=Meloidogyne enterolobii TaxID=390850 RepID=A0A6V7VD32_MELEN|nr:unnamed protein product [Meloidogyne enterolobii]
MKKSNIENQNNNLIKLQPNFNNLQKFFVEEKENNFFLENELKERDKKIEGMRLNFQKLQAEKDASDKKNNELIIKLKNMHYKYVVSYKFGCCIVCQSQLNHENVYILKDCNHTYHYECIARWITEGAENCPSCRVPATLDDIKQFVVEKASDSSDELDDETETQSSCNMTKFVNCVNFVKITNKWSEINSGHRKCCEYECINTDNPIGECIEGFGFVNLIDDENIKYINCLEGEGGYDHYVRINAENSFKNPQSCFNYSLYYFEVKCIFERDKWAVEMYIGLKNCDTNKNIVINPKYAIIENKKDNPSSVSTSFDNNDIFGCGLVYPPTNMSNKFPYIFFTQNGEQIGKYLIKIGLPFRKC